MLPCTIGAIHARQELSKTEMAVGLQRPHPELAGQSQGPVKAAFRLRELR